MGPSEAARRVFPSPSRGVRAITTRAVSDIRPPECIAKRCMKHRPGGSHAAFKSAGNLRATGFAPPVMQGNRDNAITGARRLHEHLYGPAESHLAHLELLQRSAADDTKRTDIGKRSSIQEIEQSRDEPVPQASLD